MDKTLPVRCRSHERKRHRGLSDARNLSHRLRRRRNPCRSKTAFAGRTGAFSREIEATALLGAPYIVIHPINIAVYSTDKQADFEANMDFFQKSNPFYKSLNVKLGMENMFTWDSIRNRHCPTGCSTPEDMIKYIDSANSDSFVGCLDTGHMLINCFSPAEARQKAGKTLEAFARARQLRSNRQS